MDIAVDPRIELLMAVQSTTAPYAEEGPLARRPFPYRDAAFGLARAHADLPAPRQWHDLFEAGFTFDAPVTFVLLHSALPDLVPPPDYGGYLASRAGGSRRLAPFAAALRDFAARARFLPFLAEWRGLFAAYEAQARTVIDPAWPGLLDAYAGRPSMALRVVLAPLSGGSYGPTIHGVAHSVVAPTWTEGGPRFDDSAHMRQLVLHEGAHSFVNDAVRWAAPQVAASEALFAPIAERMAGQAYSDWPITVCEHVVRALVARLSPDPEPILAEEEARGFIYIRPIAEALEKEYEADRGRYPDLRSFAPRLGAVLTGMA